MPLSKKTNSAYTGALCLLFFGVLFSFSTRNAYALTLDKTTYYINDSVVVVEEDAGWVNLFDLANHDTPLSTIGYTFQGEDIGPGGSFQFISIGNYSAVSSNSQTCTTYEECTASPDFLNEFLFTVTPAPPSGGGVSPEDEVLNVPSGVPQYGPDITISFPSIGTLFSRLGTISYKATDLNDQGKENERTLYGLPKNPVTLYYSDKIAEWDSSSALIIPADKALIAGGQPAESSYSWNIKDLVPGVFYRIVADVADATGAFAQAVSEFFTVDFSGPTFIVRTDPPSTQGKDVTISLDASENLKAPPIITVTQVSGKAVSLVMTGQGSRYEGIYAVSKGYDGVATITVSGTDVAGNVGTMIVSGGTFAVGMNPPPAPRILSPKTNSVVGTSTVAVVGTLRADTTAVLMVNGIDTYEASPNKEGAFTFSNIRLSKDTNRGLNVLSVAASDQTGLMSEAVPLQVKYNIAPTVAVSSPTDKAIVSATIQIAVQAVDENSDPLLFTYQIIPAQNFDATQAATSTKNEWDTIGNAVPSASFLWDSTEVEGGQYFLRVIADDGIAKAYSTTTPFSIRNTLPFLRFEDGRKTITNLSTATIVGRAITPDAISPRSTVKTVEYSLDNGKKWKPVLLTSGSGTPEALFSVTLTSLAEGTQGILWRVKDSRSFFGRTSHLVIVDKTPPNAPIVNSPVNNALIADADDENASKDGLQISVSGTAESQSTVILQTENANVTTKARVDGSFVFRSIDVAHRGTNQFKVTTQDDAGNKSTAAVINVVYDNPPTVSILTPKPFRGLTGKATVSWSISDADNDPIQNVILEYRRGERAFTPLKIDQSKNSFIFDVSDFPEATDYQLRLTASDGITTGADRVSFSVDTTPPVLSSFILDTSILGKDDTLRAHGVAKDSLSGIEFVEYAVAEDKPTSFSTALLTGGFLERNATFTIKYPTTLPDGTYTVYARAVDAAGNFSPILSRPFIVDASPPRIGSFDVLAQGVRIVPDEKGDISLYTGMKVLFEVSLEGDTRAVSLTFGKRSIPLKKDMVSGLWQATIDSGSASTTIYISAEDKVRNAFVRTLLGSFPTIEYGLVTTPLPDGSAEPLSGASIQVLVLDERTGNFIPFSSLSAITSDAQGKYSLALPQGTYKLSVNKSGYRSVAQKITLERAGFVNPSFSTEKFSGVWGFIQRIIDYLFS